MKEIYPGVYLTEGDRLATVNLAPGRRVYGERLIADGERELREWNPARSKLSAALLKGLKTLPIERKSSVLYLGAATGTTASHVSDIAAEGRVFSVESSVTPMSKLIEVCRDRENMIPILGDANRPEVYAPLLEEVDVIYQDIAQRNQAEILLKNSDLYLKEGGHILLAVKSKSIDSTRKAGSVISDEVAKLKDLFRILEVVDLEPYEKDHAMIVAVKAP